MGFKKYVCTNTIQGLKYQFIYYFAKTPSRRGPKNVNLNTFKGGPKIISSSFFCDPSYSVFLAKSLYSYFLKPNVFFGLSFRVFVLRFFWNSPRGCFSQKWNISISGLFTIVLFETYWSFFEVPPWLCLWEYTFWLLLECTCAKKCNFLPLHPRVFENVSAFWYNTQHPPPPHRHTRHNWILVS